MRAHEATCPVCLSICLKAHTAYRGPGGGGGSLGPQAAVDPTLLRSPCWPAGGATSPHGSVPSSLGGRFPQAAGSHVDDNMWKPLHILQDVRCPSGRLGLGTQGGPAFRALPGGPRSSLMSHQHRRSLGLGGGQGRGWLSTALHWQTPHGRSAGGSLVPDHCGVPRTRPPSPPKSPPSSQATSPRAGDGSAP